VSDYALVPVEHQPDFESVSLVPVEHDPFVDDGVTQQTQAQQAQTQPVRPVDQPQQPAAGVARLYVGPPTNNTQASEEGESWRPDTEDSYSSGPSRAATSTSAQDKPVYDSSRFKAFGELKPWTPTPTQRIGYLTADGLMALGMKPYAANDWATRLGNLLSLIPPIGVAGSALDLIDAKRRDDFPGAVAAAFGMIPGARGIARGIAGEAGAGVRALLRRSPASRAAEKGFLGIGTTPNGGPTHVGTDQLYPAGEGQRSVVPVPLTGSRRKDEKLANELGGFTDTPEGYLWHHVDDFDPKSGNATLELVKKGAHNATLPHAGSVAQYEKHHGVKYKR
jgi:hypothetical protein